MTTYSSKKAARDAAIEAGYEPSELTFDKVDGKWTYSIRQAEVEQPVENAAEVAPEATQAEVEQPAAQPEFPAEFHGSMHEDVVFEETESLADALQAEVAKVKKTLTDEQKAELLSSSAALKAAVDAFNALNEEAKEHFPLLIKKARKPAARKGKAELDAELVQLAKDIFSIETPNKSHFDRIESARAGELPELKGMDAAAYKHTVKKYSAMIDAAIEAKQVEALEEIRDEIQPYCTSQKVFKAHAALSAIAIKAQLAA